MLTKTMLKRCQNDKMQAFCALDKDVKESILANRGNQQMLAICSGAPKWISTIIVGEKNSGVYRLSPDTPTEPEYDERDVEPICGMYTVVGGHAVQHCVAMVGFLGIVYRSADGTETLRTSVDAAFGTPVRVRFAK